MNPNAQYLQKSILAIVLILVSIGLVMVYSTSAIVAQMDQSTDNAYFFIKKQVMWCLLAMAMMIACMDMPYRLLERYGYWIFGGTLLLLALVLIPGIGTKYNGARRWIRFAGFGGQPSDMMKLAAVILVATYAHRNHHKLKHFYAGFLPIFSLISLACFLILLEPDFGTCCFIFVVSITLLLVAGIRWQHLVPICFASLPVVFILAFFKFNHIKQRIDVFLNPELDPLGKGYQIRQSLIAIGTGGKFGVGLGWSQQKLFFLSEESTDFIFSIVGEELGFLGTSLILVLFISLLYYGLKVVKYAPDNFARILALGITFTIGLQATFNIAVVTQSVPAKGISLPFISFGGTGLLFTMMGVGLLLNIAGNCQDITPKESKEEIPVMTSSEKKFTFLVAGGGTGGHLIPGICLAKEIQKQSPRSQVYFQVPGKPVDLAVMKKNDFAWEINPMRSFPQSKKQYPEFSWRFLTSLIKTAKLFHRLKPDMVIGLGGYGSFSAGLLAKMRGVPLVLLESNAIPGKVVRKLSSWSEAVYTPHLVEQIARNKVVPLGVPIREELKPPQTSLPKPFTILIMGGSQGAGCINNLVSSTLPLLKDVCNDLRFLHITGEHDFLQMQKDYQKYEFTAHVFPFHHNIEELYKQSHFVICRAGGSTLAEITALGLPSIIIPFARSADGHQEANAQKLERRGAAIVLLEKELSPEKLANHISDLLKSPQKIDKMIVKAKSMGEPQAAFKIVRHIFNLLKQDEKKNQALIVKKSSNKLPKPLQA